MTTEEKIKELKEQLNKLEEEVKAKSKPIYDIGDWIFIEDNGSTVNSELTDTGKEHYGAKKGDTVQIKGITFKDGMATIKDPRYYGDNFNLRAIGFRKATQEEINKVTKQLKIKVGDYICGSYEHIGRITSINNTKYHYWGFNSINRYCDDDWDNFDEYCRLATPQEIEEFLIKVAKLKYPKPCKIDQKTAYDGSGDTCYINNNRCSVNYNGKHYNVVVGGYGVYNDAFGIWATIVPNEIKLPFGNLEFTIYKGDARAHCKHGAIYKADIKAVLDWFDKDIKVLGYSMSIVNQSPWFIRFGCAQGTIEQIRAIYKAFD